MTADTGTTKTDKEKASSCRLLRNHAPRSDVQTLATCLVAKCGQQKYTAIQASLMLCIFVVLLFSLSHLIHQGVHEVHIYILMLFSPIVADSFGLFFCFDRKCQINDGVTI